MESLVGKKFPGGEYTFERWENVLLHDVVEFPPPPDGIVHPIGLFHVPLAACGWNYRQIFEVCGAESDEAVRAGEYTWELMSPMREGIAYRLDSISTTTSWSERGTFSGLTFGRRRSRD